MRVGIMQPYLFPYLGYFHLLDAVDVLVVLDDVNYPKGGWVNRNQILINGRASWLTIPVSAAGSKISHKAYVPDGRYFLKTQRKVANAYPRAARLEQFQYALGQWFDSHTRKVGESNVYFLRNLLESLGQRSPEFFYSSDLGVQGVRGQSRILSLCSLLGATTYINLSGGRHLYDKEAFESIGIELRFVESAFPEYHQESAKFVPKMSIVDFFLSENRKSSTWLGPESYELIS